MTDAKTEAPAVNVEVSVSPREFNALLAGLRLLQRMEGKLPPGIEDIAAMEGEQSALSAEEIDALCERIN